MKKPLFRDIGEKWKNWKSELTIKKVLPHLGNDELLSKPPPGYNITEEQWYNFVRIRSDPKWMVSTYHMYLFIFLHYQILHVLILQLIYTITM